MASPARKRQGANQAKPSGQAQAARLTMVATAAMLGTIGYEVLTSLGSRYKRRYLANPA